MPEVKFTKMGKMILPKGLIIVNNTKIAMKNARRKERKFRKLKGFD